MLKSFFVQVLRVQFSFLSTASSSPFPLPAIGFQLTRDHIEGEQNKAQSSLKSKGRTEWEASCAPADAAGCDS